MHWTVVIEMQMNKKWNGNIIINIQKRNRSPVFQVFMITFFKDDMRINCLHRLTHLSNTITSIKDSISTDLADPKILRKIQQKGCLVMDVLFIIVKLIRIFYNILYWLHSYCFVCIYRFVYYCIYMDFYSIVWYLDSIYIILVTVIFIIIYICFCIVYCIYVGILFTRAPTDSRALSSDWTTLVLGLLFIFK